MRAVTSRSGPSSRTCCWRTAYARTRSSSIRLTNDLFAYVEFESEEQWAAIAETAVCQRWWAHMSELMPSRADNSPVATVLDEVFHIEKQDGRIS